MAATTSTPHRPFNRLHRAYRGYNGHQDSSETFGIPFHGSCSRCHHLHTNHLFTFSLNSTVHTRLFCESCNHPMFGLGRASTQNTLASVESNSTFNPRACVDRRDQQQPALQVEAVPSTSGLELLTTINEGRSPAPSRSASNIRSSTLSATSLPGEEASGSVRQEEPVESRAVPKSIAQENPEGQASPPQPATHRRFRTIARRFKRHFHAKRREWKLPRIHITYAHGAGTTRHPSGSASTTEVSSGQERSDNAEEIVNEREENIEDRHASLRARRRELTLAREREIALITKCECSLECPCISSSHIVQVDSNEIRDDQVPGHIFGQHHSSTESSNSQPSQNGAQGGLFSYIGGLFDSPRRSSSADESSSAAEIGTRPIRLSQSSTLWSNGSSVSLRGRRPPVGRASSMPVGTRAQYLAGARTGSQNSSLIPGPGWPESARPTAWLDERRVHGRTNYTEPSRNHEMSSHENSPSPTNPPTFQEQEQLVDGVSPASTASHTPMQDGDEAIPTPHNGIYSNGESDGMLLVGSGGLSSSSQDLANHVITDHEDHSPEIPADDRSD